MLWCLNLTSFAIIMLGDGLEGGKTKWGSSSTHRDFQFHQEATEGGNDDAFGIILAWRPRGIAVFGR